MKLDRYSMANESSKAGSAYILVICSGEQSLNPSKKNPSLVLGKGEERKGGVLLARQNKQYNTVQFRNSYVIQPVVGWPSNISSSCELVHINLKISTFIK